MNQYEVSLNLAGKTRRFVVRAWRADVAVRRALRGEPESTICKMQISVKREVVTTKQKKQLTLASANYGDRKPECGHCGRKMPKRTPISVEAKWIVAHCPYCRCMTPFKRTP